MTTTGLAVHKTDLSEVTPGLVIQGEVFQLESLYVGETKKGSPYYKCSFRNKLGEGEIKIWDPHESLAEGDFVELFLEGKDHHKWGKQWRVNHYVKSDYPGDDDFIKPLKYDPSMYTELTQLTFEDSTCKSLYSAFLKLNEEEALDEPNFINCPASRAYYTHRYGLLLYTKRVYELCKNSIAALTQQGNSYVNSDVLLLSALLHHTGSIPMFESLEFNSSKFTLNEMGFLSSPELETYKYLQVLNLRAMTAHSPVDPLVFKLIERTCRSVYTKDTISMEGIVLQNNHKLAIEMEKFDKAKEKKPGTFYIGNNKVFVDVPEIINGKASKEGSQENA